MAKSDGQEKLITLFQRVVQLEKENASLRRTIAAQRVRLDNQRDEIDRISPKAIRWTTI